jgi:hypothetical protein
MTHGDIETYFSEGEWHNRVVGEGDLAGRHPGRIDAFRAGAAEALARGVHHHVRYAGPATGPVEESDGGGAPGATGP